MAGARAKAPPMKWTKEITPSQVVQLIRAERDTRKALAIFDSATAEYPNGYRHDRNSFSLMISRLASASLFPPAEFLLSRMGREEGCSPVPEDVFVSLCRAYGRAHRPFDAIHLFERMKGEFKCEPTDKSYVTVFDILVDGNQLKAAKKFYECMRKAGMHESVAAYNVLIKAFCKSERSIDAALEVFDRMPRRGCAPDSYTYGTLINGLCKVGRVEKAMELFGEMGARGCSPSVITYCSLIHGYCRNGKLDDARELFAEMCQKGIKPNVVTYSALIDGLCKGGRSVDAMALMERMVRERCPPNMITYSSLVDGLFKEGRLLEAMEVMDRMRLRGSKPDAGLYGKLIKGLVDTGKYQEAANFLDEMILGGIVPNRLTWGVHIRMHNMVVRGLCMGKDPNRAFQVYLGMQTRSITVDPETFHLLIECFCKKGDVHKAGNIVNKMLVDGCIPDQVTWDAIVNGFWNRRKVRDAAESILSQLNNESLTFCI